MAKHVLILGGGYAGLTAATLLAGNSAFEITLVEPKTFFEQVPVSPHSLIVPTSAPAVLTDFAAKFNLKQGLLVSLASDGAKGTATLQSGETLAFDYAILATGSTYPASIKPPADRLVGRADRLKEFADTAAKVAAAQSVVVVGGGPVGVEVAAEVAERHPGKQVTLVCSGQLLQRMDARARQFAADWLSKHGVEVVAGERISDWGGLGDGPPGAATLTTASGREIRGDVVFKCVGVMPATDLFAAALLPEQLAANGSIAVEPTLQVKGWPNVFAAGDCTDTPEEKTAAYAGVAAYVAVCNLIAHDSGKEMQTYPSGTFGGHPPPVVSGFTLGTKAGAFQVGSEVQLGAGPAAIKGVISWLWVRMAAGSRWWAWVYGGMRGMVIKTITKEAEKAAAVAAAAPASTGATAAAPAVA